MIVVLSHLTCDYIQLPDQEGINLKDIVIFKNEDGHTESGKIVYIQEDKSSKEVRTMRKGTFIRSANPHDLQVVQANEDSCSQYLVLAKKVVREKGLEMRFAKVNLSFDGNKLFFLFSADERIDFRELVKILSEKTSKPVHLHQIGPRDHARIVGGNGICGKQQCCNNHLRHVDLPSITVDMIRIQHLESRGPQKLSGNCGKLLCCLDYELEVYDELRKTMPEVGKEVRYIQEEGSKNIKTGKIEDLDILGQRVKIYDPDKGVQMIPLMWIKK